MPEKLAEAYVEVSARLDSLEKELRQGVRVTEQETQKMSGLGTRAASMAASGLAAAATAGVAAVGLAGAGIVSVAQQSIAAFGDFEKGMNEVFTLIPGISGNAMDAMKGQVLDLSKEMNVLPEQVVPALYQALSAGVPQDNVFDFLETAQKAAKGGVTDLATSVDALSSVVNAYGPSVIDATKASDLMFTAVKLGKTTFDEMGQSLFQVVPTASALGVEFGNVTAAIAAITAQGTPTRVATTQIRQLLVELSKEGSGAAETFKELAGVGFKQFIEQGGNLSEALAMMEEHAKDTEVGVNDLFSSVEAGNAALQLTGQGAEKFVGFLQDMEESAGATEQAYERMTQGIKQQFDVLQSAVQRAFIRMGEALGPSMEPLVDMLVELVEIAEQELTPAFSAIAGALGGLDPDASGVRDLFKTVATALTNLTDNLMGLPLLFKQIQIALLELQRTFTLSPMQRAAMTKDINEARIEAALMLRDEQQKRELGLTARGRLDRRRELQEALGGTELDKAEQQLLEELKKLNEAEKELIDVTEKGQRQEGADANGLGSESKLLEDERKLIEAMKAPEEQKMAESGFVGFVEFGRQLQQQIFNQNKEQKEEEFRRKVEEFEKRKKELLERNAEASERVADRLEGIKVAR